MFLQYAPGGAMLPLFSLRCQELGFTAVEIGGACCTQALATLAGPLLAGQVADRWWPAQRCLAVYAFLSGALLWLLADFHRPVDVFWTTLAFWSVMSPAVTLGTALSFAHLTNPEQSFGKIRLWGTIGWVVQGWLLGYWFSNPAWALALLRPEGSELADAFRLGAVLSGLLGLYALTLPNTPPLRDAATPGHEDAATAVPMSPGLRVSVSGPKGWAPLAALGLLRQRPFAIYCLVCLGWCITVPFSSQVTPLLLTHLEIPRHWLNPTLTIAQGTEIATLAFLPLLLLRLGMRGTMLLGLTAWLLALMVLTMGQPTWLVVASLACNGLCITCFLVAGQVFINSRARGDIRASAQSLLSVAGGLGLLAGNLLVGWVRDEVQGAFRPTFAVAATLAVVLLVMFGAGFTEVEK